MSKTIKLYCCNGGCRVNNERASKCGAYVPKWSGIRTCGTCINSHTLLDDGSVPEYLLTSDDGSKGAFF